MKRRKFIALVGGAAAWPLTVRAQATKVPKVGLLSDESRSGSGGLLSFEAITNGLRKLGYVEGRNIEFESRYADGKFEILPALAAELVRMKVDIIITVGTPATRAAKSATETIPVVFSRVADPVGLGLAASLARPEANLTGVSIIQPDFQGKRLEILSELVPGLKRVGVLWDQTFLPAPLDLREVERAARLLNIELQPVSVRALKELGAAVQVVVAQRGQALVVLPATLFNDNPVQVNALALDARLPIMWMTRKNVEAGGLISYGPNFSDTYRLTASYVDKILKGSKPNDLPVQQPTKLELFINSKTAKTLGLTIPPSLLVRADEVIE
jgi:putative tryptophan/tyrosine transport system substrate-binding protein